MRGVYDKVTQITYLRQSTKEVMIDIVIMEHLIGKTGHKAYLIFLRNYLYHNEY